MDQDYPVNWNRQRKEERDKDNAAKLIKQELGKIYQQWKRTLVGSPKTPAEVNAALERLRTMCLDKLGAHPDLKDYREFTANLVGDMIARMISSDICRNNTFTPIDGAPVQFRNVEEFGAIPAIDTAAKAQDFVGFLLDKQTVLALSDDGSRKELGFVVNTVGLDWMPLASTLDQALSAKRNGAPPPTAGLAGTESAST